MMAHMGSEEAIESHGADEDHDDEGDDEEQDEAQHRDEDLRDVG